MFINQSVRLIAVSQPIPDTLPPELSTPEGLMAYCARVSSSNQDNPDYLKLLTYCMDNGHVSVFEQADMTVEIVTTRAIAAQLLRHRSFTFQEFSTRYSIVAEFILPGIRRQDTKNRQNSINDFDIETQDMVVSNMLSLCNSALSVYNGMIKEGVAKEVARMILPLCTATKLYMKGNVRSWIHYLASRTDPATQLEHREVAEMVKTIFVQQFPTIGAMLNEQQKNT